MAKLPKWMIWPFEGVDGDDNGKNDEEGFQVPPFEEDPYYQKTQDVLFPFGTDILKGVYNEQLKGIHQIHPQRRQRISFRN